MEAWGDEKPLECSVDREGGGGGCIVLTLAPIVHRWAWKLKATASAFSKKKTREPNKKLIRGVRGRITATELRGQELENIWEKEGSTLNMSFSVQIDVDRSM